MVKWLLPDTNYQSCILTALRLLNNFHFKNFLQSLNRVNGTNKINNHSNRGKKEEKEKEKRNPGATTEQVKT